MNKLQELKKKRQELLDQIKDESKAYFNSEIKPLFAKHPLLESFRWTQYTPYFNDGDTCTFSAHVDDLNFVFGGKDYEYISQWQLKDKDSKKELPSEFVAAAKAVYSFMANFDDDDFEQMFGDHVEVFAKRDGITVEEYSHD